MWGLGSQIRDKWWDKWQVTDHRSATRGRDPEGATSAKEQTEIGPGSYFRNMTTPTPTASRRPFRKFFRWVGLILGAGLILIVYFRYYFVFGEGAKAGELNYLVHKGVLFKTYEGRLIQSGVRGQSGAMQSNEFMFSVEDPELARKLMANSGQVFNLHYREYRGALPWRGVSVYVVDSIINMSEGERKGLPTIR